MAMANKKLVDMLKVVFREWNGNDNFIGIRLLCTDGTSHFIGFCNDYSGGEWCLETTHMHSSNMAQHNVIMCVNPYSMCANDLLVDIRDYIGGYGVLFEDTRPDDCIRFYEVFHATCAKLQDLEGDWQCAEIVDLETLEAVPRYSGLAMRVDSCNCVV